MFFDEIDLAPRKKAVIKQLPPIPQNGWKPPSHFPNLVGNVKALSIDVETKELDFDHGPGWARGQGHIVGFSVGAISYNNERSAWYFPVRHEVQPELNLDPFHAFNWLRDTMHGTPHVPKAGANLIYDYGWLTEENIYPVGDIHDCQFAEALLTEAGLVNLEWLGQKYLNEGKDSNTLYEWLAQAYGGNPTSAQRANIYRAPPSLVGPYAESDADLPLRILEKQIPLLEKEELLDVYRMENDSIPLIIKMRQTGVRVDINAAEKLHDELAVQVEKGHKELYEQTGVHGKAWAPADCVKYFDAAGLSYPFTEKGAPSFTAPFLETVDHPIANIIKNIRHQEKIRGTFIEGAILNSNVAGRVHCQFHPLRGDKNGTRSGRWASSNPNLQNIPVRTELGKKMRCMFLPDEGHISWESADYSQIEYRLLAHYAVGRGSDEVRAEYVKHPGTDYHNFVQKLVYEITKMWIERKPIKSVNFGLLYTMGKKALAKNLNISLKEATAIFDAYHKGAPYVKATMAAAQKEAEQLGYVTTIMGRRRRFDLWEPTNVNWENRAMPLNYYVATRTYGSQIMRAYTNIGINTRLQGSAGDTLKMGMLKAYKAGIYDVIGVPKLQIHDELNNSVIDRSPEMNEAYREHKNILENAIKFRVPLLLTRERGPNWGSCNASFCECP
jgi:DNA polymerase-1